MQNSNRPQKTQKLQQNWDGKKVDVQNWIRKDYFYQQNYISMKAGRQEVRFTLQAHSQFTGWQQEQGDIDGNILKQFRKNLNTYERNFNLETCKLKRRSNSLLKECISDKENYMKLPALNGVHMKQDYCSFLQSDFRRDQMQLQKSSVPNYAEKKGPKVFVYIDEPGRRNNRCESFIQFYRNKPEANPHNLFIKKHKVFSISRTLKFSKLKDRRVSTKLISYQPLNKELQQKYSSDISLQNA